ncbi:MAG: energy transducer TonB [Woeseiaceae bacterium]
MIARYLSSAAIGLAVTTTLLWVMNALIEISEDVSMATPDVPDLVFLPTIDDTEPQVDERRPDPVDPPVKPPPLVPPKTEYAKAGLPVIPTGPTAPEKAEFSNGPYVLTDGALINIVHAQPEYPIALAQRGIEGYVIVQFDVNVQGMIENARVIESSHSGFNKAAIKAAYRSRYKPQVVDGSPQASQALRKMFRFEMEQ